MPSREYNHHAKCYVILFVWAIFHEYRKESQNNTEGLSTKIIQNYPFYFNNDF